MDGSPGAVLGMYTTVVEILGDNGHLGLARESLCFTATTYTSREEKSGRCIVAVSLYMIVIAISFDVRDEGRWYVFTLPPSTGILTVEGSESLNGNSTLPSSFF